MQKRAMQISLVAGLIAVGLCAVVGIIVASQSTSSSRGDVLVQAISRIHANGGRLTMLEDKLEPGA